MTEKINLIGKKVRIIPSETQLQLFKSYCGANRFAYNYYLKLRKRYYRIYGKTLSWQRMANHFTKMKKRPKYSWCNDIPINVFKKAFKDLDDAYQNFYRNLKKGIDVKEAGFPKFKTRKQAKLSFGAREDRITSKNGCLSIYPKTLGLLKTKGKPLPGKLYNTRVTFDGKYWYLTYAFENDNQVKYKAKNKSIGIDLGIKTYAYLSNKTKYHNINKSKRVKKLEKKLKRFKRQASRKFEANVRKRIYYKTGEKKGQVKQVIFKRPLRECKNWLKTQEKIRLIERKLANIRDTYIHNITKEIIRLRSNKIVLEDLNVSGMKKNKHLSKSVSDCCFYKFKQYLTDKAKRYLGIDVTLADRWYPSSKTCSSCGNIKKDLKLKDRVYKCDCGLILDRDYNASLNLKAYAV